jgi:hypothetical protein
MKSAAAGLALLLLEFAGAVLLLLAVAGVALLFLASCSVLSPERVEEKKAAGEAASSSAAAAVIARSKEPMLTQIRRYNDAGCGTGTDSGECDESVEALEYLSGVTVMALDDAQPWPAPVAQLAERTAFVMASVANSDSNDPAALSSDVAMLADCLRRWRE